MNPFYRNKIMGNYILLCPRSQKASITNIIIFILKLFVIFMAINLIKAYSLNHIVKISRNSIFKDLPKLHAHG